jgi:hypothetical protein
MKYALIAALLLTSGVQTLENESQMNNIAAVSEIDQLQAAAHLYLRNLEDASFLNADEIAARVSTMCAPSCKKIVNGKVIFESSEHYSVQLTNIKKDVGTWTVQPLEILTDVGSRAAMIRQLVFTEKAGVLIVFVVLRFDDEYKITEIDEVYNKFNGKS